MQFVIFFSLALQAPWALASVFQFHDHFTDGRTSWTSDQPVARPQPAHKTTQTQKKHIHTPNIHVLCGIRTHDPSFRASEATVTGDLCYADANFYVEYMNTPGWRSCNALDILCSGNTRFEYRPWHRPFWVLRSPFRQMLVLLLGHNRFFLNPFQFANYPTIRSRAGNNRVAK
jgi:hypothetical protein